jgi:hypothetical protein
MRDQRHLLLVLVVAAACARRPADPQPGSAAWLAGTWELVAHRTDQPDLLGTVTIAPSAPDDSTVPAALRGGTLEGHFRLTNLAWLSAGPRDSGASAFIAADSAVVLYLRLQGRCANCGNLGFAGHLMNGRVAGHWVQELSSDPPQGMFELRRSSSR